MWGRRRRARSDGGRAVGGDPRRTGTPREREAAVRERLTVLAGQRLELLADESVPGRRHRLDALRDACRDLEAELAELVDPAAPVEPVEPVGSGGCARP